MKMESVAQMGAKALSELGACLDKIDETEVVELIEILATSKRICLYGGGREGLMMRALCMRLYHMGLDVHMVADMTTPPVGPGDLLLVSAGPGNISTVQALLGQARRDGAKTACFTAEPGSPVTLSSDFTFIIPAQTMARDTSGPTSFLPMGSLYEGAQFLFYEILVIMLRDRIGESPESMRARHTNLE
ncbi:MAG: putative 6-phospho-3-hexuloisomerase [Rhizobium sp.]|nr:putative 6-phospho-3-hexuloisomerase [Rhizobium sp.]